MKQVSVYQITAPNGKLYIGISVDPKKRWMAHRCSDYAIGRAIRKYGDQMRYDIICVCDDMEEAHVAEKFYIGMLQTKSPNGYNFTDGGDGAVGYKHSDANKIKMSKKATGRKHSLETRAKISKTTTGIKRSQETRANMSKAKRKVTPEIHANILKLRAENSAREVGKMLNLDRSTVRKWVNTPLENIDV